ncbi:hypothetical protein [Streptomyces sp. M92]|uniref:hypothetical protein n=1 Tax=Streptomyces sp. M92 TaxID=2944250 RepID=UPI002349A9E3|nr:hypothetical protein [Streptomyces sp. M92]WCN05185.1 hypothetical protein M6G08_25470 [Streptomyces sp. M92]
MSEQNRSALWAVPEQLERVLATEVSLRYRLRHVAVGLVGSCGAAVIAVLWPPSRMRCRRVPRPSSPD